MEQKLKSLGIEKWIMYLMVAVIIVIPIVFYIHFFKSSSISTDPEDWSFFGGFLAGAYTLIVGTLNLIYLIYLSKKVQEIDHERNERNIEIEHKRNLQNKIDAVVPFGVLKTEKTNNSFSIMLKNTGIGPLIIKDFFIISKNGERTHIKDILEYIILNFKNEYGQNVIDETDSTPLVPNKSALSPGESIIIISVVLKKIVGVFKNLEDLEGFLLSHEFNIVYTNIYKNTEEEI